MTSKIELIITSKKISSLITILWLKFWNKMCNMNNKIKIKLFSNKHKENKWETIKIEKYKYCPKLIIFKQCWPANSIQISILNTNRLHRPSLILKGQIKSLSFQNKKNQKIKKSIYTVNLSLWAENYSKTEMINHSVKFSRR